MDMWGPYVESVRTHAPNGASKIVFDRFHEHVISYGVMFQAFHSPVLGGFAVISHWMPFLFFSVHAGALADRYDCRKLIQISQGLFMVASIAWGLLFLTGTLAVWHAVVILLVHGGAGVLAGPSIQLIIHDIVGTDQLQSAIRLNARSRNLSVLLGPAAGGGLMLLLGPAWGLLTNVLIYVPAQLRGCGGAPHRRRHAERHVHVDGPDAGPDPGAAASARAYHRPVQRVDARSADRQRSDGGCARRRHRRSLVAGPERGGRGGHRARGG
jgi:hypothetical protein